MKNFKNLIILFFVLVLFNTSVFAEQLYKSCPIIDNKTDIELLRVIIPEEFQVKSNILWSRNIATPVSVKVKAENPEKTALFYYLSPKTFVVMSNVEDEKILSSNIDTITNIKIENDEKTEFFIKRILYSLSPDAKNIKLVSQKTISEDLRKYLLEEFYKKSLKHKNNMKINKRIFNSEQNNHFVNPVYSTYSFSENGKEYIQTFITMSAGLDYKYTLANSDEERSGKIIENYGVFSYKAEKSTFEKYQNDFLIFVANTMFNRKAIDALDFIKIQMSIELNPMYRDLKTGKKTKNIPSNLFVKYYIGGKSDYAEYIPLHVPYPGDVRWIITLDNNFEKFDYKTITDVWKQKIYTTYPNAFYNKETKQFSFEKSDKVKRPWKKLKKSVDTEQNRRYDVEF